MIHSHATRFCQIISSDKGYFILLFCICIELMYYQRTMKSFQKSAAFLFVAFLATSLAFTAPVGKKNHPRHGGIVVDRPYSSPSSSSTSRLFNTPPETKTKKKPYDEKLRKKLLSESIAPWRTIRLFLYGSLGSGAFVGGFIQLTGLLAALSAGKPDIDMNTEVGLKIQMIRISGGQSSQVSRSLFCLCLSFSLTHTNTLPPSY